MIKSAWRSTKNFVKGYSGIQIKVRKATSVDPWGPTMPQMAEVAAASNNPVLFADIVYVIDKRLNDHGKYWRHVYKTLVLLEYCVVCGHENVVRYAKDKIYLIRTLKEFVHYDQYGREQGSSIRQKADDLLNLITNDAMLAEARSSKTLPTWTQNSNVPQITYPGHENRSGPDATEDFELQQAIEESKRTAVEEEQRRRERAQSAKDFNHIPDAYGQQSSRRTQMYYEENYSQPNVYYSGQRTEYSNMGSRSSKSSDPLPSSNNRLAYPERKAIMMAPSSSLENPFLDQNRKSAAPNIENPFNEVEQQNPFDDDFTNMKLTASMDNNPFHEYNENQPKAEPNNDFTMDQSSSSFTIPRPRKIRSHTVDELSVGAKPVLPANLAPQFSASRPTPRPDPTYRPG